MNFKHYSIRVTFVCSRQQKKGPKETIISDSLVERLSTTKTYHHELFMG